MSTCLHRHTDEDIAMQFLRTAPLSARQTVYAVQNTWGWCRNNCQPLRFFRLLRTAPSCHRSKIHSNLPRCWTDSPFLMLYIRRKLLFLQSLPSNFPSSWLTSDSFRPPTWHRYGDLLQNYRRIPQLPWLQILTFFLVTPHRMPNQWRTVQKAKDKMFFSWQLTFLYL